MTAHPTVHALAGWRTPVLLALSLLATGLQAQTTATAQQQGQCQGREKAGAGHGWPPWGCRCEGPCGWCWGWLGVLAALGTLAGAEAGAGGVAGASGAWASRA